MTDFPFFPIIYSLPPSDLDNNIISDPLSEWDLTLTKICRSKLTLTDRIPASAQIVLLNNWKEIILDLQTVSGCNGPWPENRWFFKRNLYFIETCTTQMSRSVQLEMTVIQHNGKQMSVPSDAEIFRIKTGLVLTRNSVRDYVDLAVFSAYLGTSRSVEILKDFDRIYLVESERRLMVQLLEMLSSPVPYDLSVTNFDTYEDLTQEWRVWNRTVDTLRNLSHRIFDASCQGFSPRLYEGDDTQP
jgi:hypothetical protein